MYKIDISAILTSEVYRQTDKSQIQVKKEKAELARITSRS